MSQPRKILTIFGTRPEAIKMAPLVKELQKHPDLFDCRVAVTAQHREMLDQVLEHFDIAPDHDLNIMAPRQTLTDIAVRALAGLEDVVAAEKPDAILVHGDTSTTFLGALVGFYHKITVGHVEAGLRSFNKYSPWPEEVNRRLAGVVADLHFAPTDTNRENLLGEGVRPESIFVTGNTAIDALFLTVRKTYRFREKALDRVPVGYRRIITVTAHRRENWGEPMRQMFSAMRDLVQEFPDVELVYPVHKNPAVRDLAEPILGGRDRVHLIEPLDYPDQVNLMARSYLVLTDSGGIQEEAPSLGVPVLLMRDTTERPEGVAAGTVRMVGTRQEDIFREASLLLSDGSAHQAMARTANPFGDGRASERIAQALAYHYGLSAEPPHYFGS